MPGEPAPEPGEIVAKVEDARDEAIARAQCIREEAAIQVPIITFHGAGIAAFCTDGGSLLVEGCYPDAGSLEGTKDLGTGEVTLVFKGVGTMTCADGTGAAVFPGMETHDQGCWADIDPQDLECYAWMIVFGDDGIASWVNGQGVCTVSEVRV